MRPGGRRPGGRRPGLAGLLLGLAMLAPACLSSKQWVAPPLHPCPEFPLLPCNCTAGTDEGIAVLCENTNLASMAVGLRRAAGKIKNLTIVNCNIERLYGDVFRTNQITKLSILDTPIREIRNDTFIGLETSLEELRIENSRLETFPRGAISRLTKLQRIVIDRSDLAEIPPNAFLGLSELKEIQVSHSRVGTMDRAALAGQRKLKMLRLHHNNISDIVAKTFDFGQNLQLLDLSYNKIGKIKPTFFNSLLKLNRLNLTDNGISEFKSRMVSRNQLLAVLHLESNNLTRLDSNSFRGMRFMRRLYFDYNQIAAVGRQTFQAMGRIGGIHLRGNRLSKIDFQMFNDLRYVETIDVSQNQISVVESNSFKALYQAVVNISYNSIETIPAGVFVQCDNISLDLSHNGLKDIHTDAFDELSFAYSFNVSHNLLSNHSQIPMKHQKGIKFLDASHNQLVEIPRNTFPKLYELESINYSYNNLTSIYRSVFVPLFSIRHLNFSHNHMEQLESSTMGKVPTVLDVDFSYNRLTKIKRGAFRGLVSLRIIWLDHNQLKEIPTPTISLNHMFLSHNNISNTKRGRVPWPVMNSLISLDLDHNLFGDNLAESGRFQGLNVLQSLSLRANGISRPPWESLEALQSLRYLRLDRNNITVLGKRAFGRLPVVFTLGLSENKINNISVEAFGGLQQLIHLELSMNNLSWVPPGAFKTLVSLQTVDLSHNRLERLENKTAGLFDDCFSIKAINLSYNNIPFVTKRMFPYDKWQPVTLESVDLSHNMMPVLSDGILIGTSHLRSLNLSHNILNDIRKYILGNLTSLTSLDLSHNSLTDRTLKEERWGGPLDGVLPNLTYLSVASNKLYTIPGRLLSTFPKLRTLDLSGNDLIHYHPEFTPLVKGGLDLKYAGNILRCECSLRPVLHWLRAGGRASSWDAAHCHSPGYLSGRTVSSVREEQLVCDTSVSQGEQDFAISPDIKFRDIKDSASRLELSWYVNTNEDVGDFRVQLSNGSGTLLVKDIGYTNRYDVIDSSLPNSGGMKLKMCLLVKTSLGRIRRWREDQCQAVGPFSRGVPSLHMPGPLLLLLLLPILFA